MSQTARRGKLIVIYGINNLGKTTQAKLLVEKIKSENKKAEYLKYGIYNLFPTGEILNDYLRKNNPFNLTSREFQLIHVLNRTQYQPILEKRLKSGINIVAEDYIGTGVAWGIGAGVDKNFLMKINSHLIKEDIVILFDGQRFSEAVEKTHRHEADDDLTDRVRRIHLRLAGEFGWHIVKANDAIENVRERIWEIVKDKI